MNGKIEYGGIYLVSFDPQVGHEYQGSRPAVVIQSASQLYKTNLVTVMPLTSQIGKPHGDDILVKADKTNNLLTDSLVKVHNIESFDRARFLKQIGRIDVSIMLKVRAYLKIHFNIK